MKKNIKSSRTGSKVGSIQALGVGFEDAERDRAMSRRVAAHIAKCGGGVKARRALETKAEAVRLAAAARLQPNACRHARVGVVNSPRPTARSGWNAGNIPRCAPPVAFPKFH